MRGVLILSTALALFAAGSVQTRSRLPMSQVSAPAPEKRVAANAPSAGPTAGRTPAATSADRATASTAAKSVADRSRMAGAQQTVATTTSTRDTRVVPTAMLAPAALPSDSRLVSRIQTMLPATLAADQAAFGFRTQIQFVSAVFAAKNLDIPFSELKTRLLTQGMTLDESIHALQPKADATAEADRALREADAALSNPE